MVIKHFPTAYAFLKWKYIAKRLFEHFSKAYDLPKVEIISLEIITPLLTAYNCLKWKLQYQHRQAIIKHFPTAHSN